MNDLLEILALAKKVYQKVEALEPEILAHCPLKYGNGYESIYFFDYENKIDGKITKKVNHSYFNNETTDVEYSISARVGSVNIVGVDQGCAKVGIFLKDKHLKHLGKKSKLITYDSNFFKNPDFEIPLVLKMIKDYLAAFLRKLERDTLRAVKQYDRTRVRKATKY